MAASKKSLPIHSFVNERVLVSSLDGVRAILALDEVGRGCLAGPVVTGASLWVPASLATHVDPDGLQKLWLPLIRDSKKLTPRARDICFEAASQSFTQFKRSPAVEHVRLGQEIELCFDDCGKPSRAAIAFDTKGRLGPSKSWTDVSSERFLCCGVAIGAASAQEIDSINIWNAVQLAMGRAMLSLAQVLDEPLRPLLDKATLVIDGNHAIKVPARFAGLPQVTAVGGDDHFVSVGLSSVVAKVVRDRAMETFDEEFSAYQFAKHKGYATAEHRAAIVRHGPTVLHRKSFLGNLSSPVLDEGPFLPR